MTYRLKGTLIYSFAARILIFGLIIRNAPTLASEAKTFVYLRMDIFYVIYFLFQLPFGFFFDRFKFRKVYFWAILTVSIGAIIPIFTKALIGPGSVLIVAGAASVFVGTLVLSSRWFPHRFFRFLLE